MSDLAEQITFNGADLDPVLLGLQSRPLDEAFDRIIATPGSYDQLCMLRKLRWNYPTIQNTEYRDELARRSFDFAISPEFGAGLAPRIDALEVALDCGFGKDVLPLWTKEANSIVREVQAPEGEYYPYYGDRSLRYQFIVWQLAEDEGIPQIAYFPDLNGEERYTFENYTPVRALLALDRVFSDESKSPEEQMILDKLCPLATDLQEYFKNRYGLPLLTTRSIEEWRNIQHYSKLVKYGEEHSGHLTEFINNGMQKLAPYLEPLMQIHDKAPGVARIFPIELREGVEEGLRQLVADALYALKYHSEMGGHTDVTLEVSEKLHLPLKLNDADLLRLLEDFRQVIGAVYSTSWGGTAYRPGVAVGKAICDEAVYYPLVDHTGVKTSKYVFIRDVATDEFDPSLEYAGEASINVVVDTTLREGGAIELGPHLAEGPDNRVSVRVDLEKDGRLSLDVGALVGGDGWLGAKLARFLAWGNILRGAQRNEKPVLNHMRYHFENSGITPEEFTEIARRFKATIGAGKLALGA